MAGREIQVLQSLSELGPEAREAVLGLLSLNSEEQEKVRICAEQLFSSPQRKRGRPKGSSSKRGTNRTRKTATKKAATRKRAAVPRKRKARRGRPRKNRAEENPVALVPEVEKKILEVAKEKAEDGKTTRQAIQLDRNVKALLKKTYKNRSSDAFKAHVASLVNDGKLEVSHHTWTLHG